MEFIIFEAAIFNMSQSSAIIKQLEQAQIHNINAVKIYPREGKPTTVTVNVAINHLREKY